MSELSGVTGEFDTGFVNSLIQKITDAQKIIAEVCKQCGEKEYPDGCQNDCWFHDLEQCLCVENKEPTK